MSISSFLFAILLLLCACLLSYKLCCIASALFTSYPISLPFVGHLLSFPSYDEHVGFLKMGERLNRSVLSLRIFNNQVVILNSLDDVTNLLEKRSSIYSDRVCPPMLAEPSLTNWGGFVGFLPYNHRWHTSRRLMRPWLSKSATEGFHSCQSFQTHGLLRRLFSMAEDLTRSEDLENELYQAIATTLADYVYGYTAESHDDPLIADLKTTAHNFVTASLPGKFLVNIFPSLMYVPSWFPGAGWKNTARKWREQQEATVTAAYELTKTQMALGTNRCSIVSSLLTHAEDFGLSPEEVDDHIKYLAITLYIAGPDTVVSTLLIFVIAMLHFPEVQKRAQQEIDGILNQDQLPTLGDQQRLEYVNRLVLEVLRWRPIAPLGGPHAASQDDVYQDVHVSQGATVFANIWAITQDEGVYKNPEVFHPDRYLDPQEMLPPVFGFGRRACPGIHYAKASLFLYISSILSTFDIIPVKDVDGNDMIPALESADQVPYHTNPFRVKFVLRSAQRIASLRAEELI